MANKTLLVDGVAVLAVVLVVVVVVIFVAAVNQAAKQTARLPFTGYIKLEDITRQALIQHSRIKHFFAFHYDTTRFDRLFK